MMFPFKNQKSEWTRVTNVAPVLDMKESVIAPLSDGDIAVRRITKQNESR